jgi:Cu/Ag efflux protein CusF
MRNTMLAATVLFALSGMPVWAEYQAGAHAQGKITQATHQGTGKVVSIEREKLKVKLEHAPIPSLNWPGMTMDFVVTRAALLDKLQPGMQINFTLVAGDKPGRWVIDNITLR